MVGESLKRVGAITLFVSDVGAAKAFYLAVFGAAVVYEDGHSAAFKFENMIVNLLHRGEAAGLIGPARVAAAGAGGVGGAGGAGASFQLTVWVKDADAVCAELAARGVKLINGPMDRVWGMRTACFADPDGHVWEVAQEIGK